MTCETSAKACAEDEVELVLRPPSVWTCLPPRPQRVEFELTRCSTAQCCRNFPLSVPLAELRENVRHHAARASATTGELPPCDAYGRPPVLDAAFVVDMVIPVRRDEHGLWRYRCRHLVGNDCSVYERRPHLCRDFPYGRRCDHADDGCTRQVVRTRIERLGARIINGPLGLEKEAG